MRNLKETNLVVATGSVDGTLTTAALVRFLNKENVNIIFTQAFAVDKIDLSKLKENSKISFVDLAVNNRNPQMTKTFLQELKNAGHEIVAIIDEHDAELWHQVYGDLSELAIKPVSQNVSEIKSSGALLKNAIGDKLDEQGLELCTAADEADAMNFSSHFASYCNRAVKSKIWDNSRRIHLSEHFSKNHEPSEKISLWIKEYENILETHEEIIEKAEKISKEIIKIDCRGRVVDMTTLMNSLYNKGNKIVAVVGEMYNKILEKKTVQVSFGTKDRNLDLLKLFSETDVKPTGGFASKVNFELADSEAALEIIQENL